MDTSIIVNFRPCFIPGSTQRLHLLATALLPVATRCHGTKLSRKLPLKFFPLWETGIPQITNKWCCKSLLIGAQSFNCIIDTMLELEISAQASPQNPTRFFMSLKRVLALRSDTCGRDSLSRPGIWAMRVALLPPLPLLKMRVKIPSQQGHGNEQESRYDVPSILAVKRTGRHHCCPNHNGSDSITSEPFPDFPPRHHSLLGVILSCPTRRQDALGHSNGNLPTDCRN